MRNLFFLTVFCFQASAPSTLRVETLVSGLDTPWDLAWGLTDRSG